MSNFYKDVIALDPRFNDPSRITDINLLEPITRQSIQSVIADAQSMGISVMVFETYRSQARQQALFNSGASQLKDVGVHHYGLACDIVKSVNGDPSWKGDFSFLGHLARAHNLIWGGDWGRPGVPYSFVDLVHLQRCTVDLQPVLFRGEWYPDPNYNPYEETRAPTNLRIVP